MATKEKYKRERKKIHCNAVDFLLKCRSTSFTFNVNTHWLFVEINGERVLVHPCIFLHGTLLSCWWVKRSNGQSLTLLASSHIRTRYVCRLTTVGYGFIRHLGTCSFYERPVYGLFFYDGFSNLMFRVIFLFSSTLFGWQLNFSKFCYSLGLFSPTLLFLSASGERKRKREKKFHLLLLKSGLRWPIFAWLINTQ